MDSRDTKCRSRHNSVLENWVRGVSGHCEMGCTYRYGGGRCTPLYVYVTEAFDQAAENQGAPDELEGRNVVVVVSVNSPVVGCRQKYGCRTQQHCYHRGHAPLGALKQRYRTHQPPKRENHGKTCFSPSWHGENGESIQPSGKHTLRNSHILCMPSFQHCTAPKHQSRV
jgi:hypothetical protein